MSNSTLGALEGLTFEDIYQFKFTYYAQLASLTFAAYDSVLTFSDDVELFWNRKWAWVHVIYIFVRYLIPIQAGLNIMASLDGYLPNVPCNGLNLFTTLWSIPLFMTVIEAVLILRVIALYNNSKRICIILWTLLSISFAIMVILSSFVSQGIEVIASPFPSIIGCLAAGTPDGPDVSLLMILLFIPTMILEIILVSLTAIKATQHVRASVNTAMLVVITRDGCLYFAVVFSLMLTNLIVYAIPNPIVSIQPIVTEIQLCLSSVLCSRMLLNLRATAYRSTIYDSDMFLELDTVGDSNWQAPSGLGRMAVTTDSAFTGCSSGVLS